MASKTAVEYPNIPSVLALVGGALIVFFDVILLAVSITILPHLNYTHTNYTPPRGFTGNPGDLAAGFVGALAAFGLACGILVTLSAIMLRLMPVHRQTWGILMLVFSILGFFGFGGIIIGSVLGILGGIMTLTWKPPTTATSQQPAEH